MQSAKMLFYLEIVFDTEYIYVVISSVLLQDDRFRLLLHLPYIYNAFTLYISVFSYLLFAILAILSLLERKIEWGNSARPGRMYECSGS